MNTVDFLETSNLLLQASLFLAIVSLFFYRQTISLNSIYNTLNNNESDDEKNFENNHEYETVKQKIKETEMEETEKQETEEQEKGSL